MSVLTDAKEIVEDQFYDALSGITSLLDEASNVDEFLVGLVEGLEKANGKTRESW